MTTSTSQKTAPRIHYQTKYKNIITVISLFLRNVLTEYYHNMHDHPCKDFRPSYSSSIKTKTKANRIRFNP